jgi:hypothetical protein
MMTEEQIVARLLAGRLDKPPKPKPNPPELVAPLSGPSYGPYSVARRRWRKPLPAIIADALANNRAIIDRFKLGVTPPDPPEKRSHYQEVFDALCQTTDAQIAALEAFSKIEWRG